MDMQVSQSDRSHTYRSWTTALAIATFCSLFAPHLRAQQSASPQEAEADAHFRSGLEQMRMGHFDVACPELLESYRLDPLPGALFTVAECEASWGKSATATEHYEAFINMLTSLEPGRRDKFDERRRIALERISALTMAAPKLQIEVPPAAPARLVVKRNDVVVESSAYGVEKRVDTGAYLITAELDGKVVWLRHVTLAERDRAQIDVPWPPPGLMHESAPPASVQSTSGSPVSDSRSGSSSRTWIYVAGGVGVLGLTTGIVAGSLALGQKSKINDNCPNQICNADGRAALDTAKREALISTVAFSVGLAGAAATTVLLMSSRPAQAEHRGSRSFHVHPSATVSNRGGGLALDGEF